MNLLQFNVLEYRRISARIIAAVVWIFHENVGHTYTTFRRMYLKADQKRTKVTSSKASLSRFAEEGVNFTVRVVHIDDSWLRHYGPPNKQQSIESNHGKRLVLGSFESIRQL